jgi:hypothetical protein
VSAGTNSNILNRGIYFIINSDEPFDDKKNDPTYLTVPKGAVKFGKSLDLKNVFDRYQRHTGNNIKVFVVSRIRDRDDIDNIEKLLHAKFKNKRLINKNNRRVEWMKPIGIDEIKRGCQEVLLGYFGLIDFIKLINESN